MAVSELFEEPYRREDGKITIVRITRHQSRITTRVRNLSARKTIRRDSDYRDVTTHCRTTDVYGTVTTDLSHSLNSSFIPSDCFWAYPWVCGKACTLGIPLTSSVLEDAHRTESSIPFVSVTKGCHVLSPRTEENSSVNTVTISTIRGRVVLEKVIS